MENQAPARKKIIFSGIQPSGQITLGNYLGAVRNWGTAAGGLQLHLQHRQYARNHCAPGSGSVKTANVGSVCADSGLRRGPGKIVAFIQSHVKEHAEANWVLSCYTQFGELNRMTQFKDKSAKNPDNINAGLFTYPVLMAGDILLYQTDLVPVGIDQKQHLELARDVAIRFNGQHGNTFVVPDGYIPKMGAKIMSLQDPSQEDEQI